MSGPVVLEVKDLETRFHTQDGTVHAVNGVSFALRAGQFVGVVGESGSGKSVTMMSLLGLIPMPPGKVTNGTALFDGDDLLALDETAMQDIRGNKIGFIFQDPMTSLNPVLRVGKQIAEGLQRHQGVSKKNALARARELLEIVGIPDPDVRIKNYPHEMSGGMRQRVMIAIALACNPQVIIADEPTTALDVTVQAQIIEQMRHLRETYGTAVIWITHDLAVVAGLCSTRFLASTRRATNFRPSRVSRPTCCTNPLAARLRRVALTQWNSAGPISRYKSRCESATPSLATSMLRPGRHAYEHRRVSTGRIVEHHRRRTARTRGCPYQALPDPQGLLPASRRTSASRR